MNGNGRPEVCEWLTLRNALKAFALCEKTQSARHIKRMHWYVACRLVVEGGFHPDDITPRPPFRIERVVRNRRVRMLLHYDPSRATGGERTLIGGLKTKDVDVVVSLDGIGPCVAVSMKGTLNAFRNLTNRLEEAVGDCTNLHIAYPALVYGFLHVMKANSDGLPADISVLSNGDVDASVRRYHDAIARLAGRRDMRDDITRYESLSIVLVHPVEPALGEMFRAFPPQDSPLHFDRFFANIYEQYDLRFVYGAPNLAWKTRRLAWDPDSPAIAHQCMTGIEPRIASGTGLPIDAEETSASDDAAVSADGEQKPEPEPEFRLE